MCGRLGIPLWCGANDVEAVEEGKMVMRCGRLAPATKAHPVTRALIREPYPLVSADRQLNRESARRLASLEPSLVCVGHGKPVTDTRRFIEAVERLQR